MHDLPIAVDGVASHIRELIGSKTADVAAVCSDSLLVCAPNTHARLLACLLNPAHLLVHLSTHLRQVLLTGPHDV